MKKKILSIIIFIIMGILIFKGYSIFGTCRLQISQRQCTIDKNKNGINDVEDILKGARAEVLNKTKYKSQYYNGGYPPENEGVCTDVIWRAFKNAGYNLKDEIDNDIETNLKFYPRIKDKSDTNIDFRRVPNLVSFFNRHAKTLTPKIKPYNKDNLKEWQAGDIVVFYGRKDHIAIISDKRRGDGVPYIIHNAGPYPKEEDGLRLRALLAKGVYHFRWK
ncbi:DUF1287 domain-containing protein [Clostridium botulinum]|uniref:DUF1287 domain-containing protein n=1 Tax=Clostridium botulinum TaxID=1491 RepID=A0A9Q1UWS5_CLOBO|nr:DUF1287 domain-containing protein [Clostridium botulinum]KEI01043.1 hypothetical protein Z953_09290 [Clostridium botulinum D str. 16868]KEI04776.1 hypothetical protein Y848_12755 [Clostridium botulinum C/D str. Sp77]KLU75985.1 hypothetical protein CBC3_05840 [Clostridium botulinum V891]KOA74892.1 hypothetical protein ADU78_09730 [Clostridium botulinum]KOA78233.1 hypothetical protein ADU77_06260 [Clostridium botulinum]